jgi:WD40 repeat protein
MNSYENEYVLKTIINTFKLLKIKQIFNKVSNKTLSQIIYSMIDFDTIFCSIGSSNNSSRHTLEFCAHSLALLDDGKLLIASLNSTINIWDLRKWPEKIESKTYYIKTTLILPNGNIVLCSYDGQIKIFDKDKFNCIKTLTFTGYDCFNKLLLLDNGNLACSGLYQNSHCIIILDCHNEYALLETLKGHSSVTMALASINNDRIASGSHDTNIKIWDVSFLFTCLKTIKTYDIVLSLLFDKRTNYLISGRYRIIDIWDVDAAYTCVRSITAHNGWIASVLELSNGYFASGSSDNRIKLWNLKNYKCVNTLRSEHYSSILSIIMLKDNRIVSTMTDETIIVWEY